MAEQEQSVSQEPQTSTDTSEPTLEQVYKQFNVEETASEFRQEPIQRQEPVIPQQTATPNLGSEIPDAVLDQAGFKSWLAAQSADTRKALGELRQTQQRIAVAEMRRQEESDIKGAVSTVKELVGGELDDDFVEIALGQKARKDPRFARIWSDRHKNPAALKAALRAVGNEFKGKYQFRQDSQLTENVRAARQSTQTTQTTQADTSDNPVDKALAGAKTQKEFENIWARYLHNG